jgi:hypothetical protein
LTLLPRRSTDAESLNALLDAIRFQLTGESRFQGSREPPNDKAAPAPAPPKAGSPAKTDAPAAAAEKEAPAQAGQNDDTYDEHSDIMKLYIGEGCERRGERRAFSLGGL